MQVCLSTYDLLSTSVTNVLTRKKILTTDSENWPSIKIFTSNQKYMNRAKMLRELSEISGKVSYYKKIS